MTDFQKRLKIEEKRIDDYRSHAAEEITILKDAEKVYNMLLELITLITINVINVIRINIISSS